MLTPLLITSVKRNAFYAKKGLDLKLWPMSVLFIRRWRAVIAYRGLHFGAALPNSSRATLWAAEAA